MAGSPEFSATIDDMQVQADEWPGVIIYYRDLLTATIRPKKLIFKMKLNLGDCAEVEKAMTLDLDNRCTEAAEVFMQYLLAYPKSHTDEDVRSMWSLFNQELKSEYPWLHGIIHNYNNLTQPYEQQRQLIKFFASEICSQLNPMHIFPRLVASGLLDQAELENLHRICDQRGPTSGAYYLIGHIHRNTADWFDKFVDALIKEGYGNIVAELVGEEKMKTLKEKAQTGKAAESQPGDLSQCVSAEQETVLKGVGEAHVSRPPNLAAPKQNGCNMEESDKETNLFSLEETSEKMAAFSISEDGGAETTESKAVMMSEPEISAVASCAGGAINMFDDQNQDQNKQESLTGKEIADKNVLSSEALDNSNAELNGLAKTEEEEVGETIELRDYQQELVEQALRGRNVLICAPTGSGKTHVALKAMQSHLQQKDQGVRKVVFLVNQVALADQQYNQCFKYLRPFRCQLVSGDAAGDTRVPLKHLLMRADILVMTAQILLDALDKKEIEDICEFSLLVFDECHHTDRRHPFNCIMHHYMTAKFPPEDDQHHDRKLPQVIGLTASVGVGKAGDQEKAKKHILKLCAHLDADYICTVTQHAQQLAQFSNDPTYDLHTVQQRRDDRFQRKIEDIMKQIEEKMEKSELTEKIHPETGIKDKLKPPSRRGVDQYTIWVTQLRRPVAMIEDAMPRRFLESCRRQLEFYNTSIGINDECDTEDALKYLTSQFDRLNENMGMRPAEIDIFLKDLFEKNKPYLEQVSRIQANTNPKLIKLEELLVQAFGEEPESRAMVFVKTRDLASAIQQWMLRRPDLKKLRPGKIVGAGPSTEKGGMTKNQQVDVMTYFREGDHHIMIATSVAEEGLDIRKCNLVIRYNHVTNEIAMVQARGRARAENSKFVTLASQGKGVQEKDEINLIREIMMREAIKELQDEMRQRHADYRHKIEEIQKEEKSVRDFEAAQRKGRRLREGEVVLRCRTCDQYACLSTDIKTLERSHHVITDLDFKDRSIEKPHPRPCTYGEGMEKKGKLHCKVCGTDWGIIVRYRKTKFPVIKIDSFVVVDEYGKRDAPTKWKQATFSVEELTLPELEEYRKDAAAVGYVFEN